MFSKVGHIINSVRNREIPIRTDVGGTCWSESARLMKSSTIEMRKKLVINMMMLGARDRTVSNRRSCIEKATSCPVSGSRTVKSMKGIAVLSGEGIAVVPDAPMSPGNPDACAAANPPPHTRNTVHISAILKRGEGEIHALREGKLRRVSCGVLRVD
jgi:hypothetical protein